MTDLIVIGRTYFRHPLQLLKPECRFNVNRLVYRCSLIASLSALQLARETLPPICVGHIDTVALDGSQQCLPLRDYPIWCRRL
jgi:hypothetical protein